MWAAFAVSGCGANRGPDPTDGPLVVVGGDASPDREMTAAEAGPSSSVGDPCDVLTDAGPATAIVNGAAPECSSRICIKPAYGPGTVTATGAYCSAACEQDSDCAGAPYAPNSPTTADHRCQTGFVCGIPFVKGRLCCQKLCMCRDFVGDAGLPTPTACRGDAGANCMEPQQ